MQIILQNANQTLLSKQAQAAPNCRKAAETSCKRPVKASMFQWRHSWHEKCINKRLGHLEKVALTETITTTGPRNFLHKGFEWLSRTSGWAHLLAAVLLVYIYQPLFLLFAKEYWVSTTLDGTYAHAPLVVIGILFLVWQRRHVFRTPASDQVSFKGLVLMAVGAATEIYGSTHGYLVLQGLSLIPFAAGIVLTLHGESAWRAIRFPLLMLVFVVPLPNAGIDAITRPLATLTGDLVIPMLLPFDIAVTRAGQVLSVRGLGHDQFHQVIIAAECSGIRSLLALLAISSMLACLRGHSALRTSVLLLLTPLLTLLGNAVRIVITTVMIVYVDPASAESFYHSASGILAVVISLCGIFAVDRLMDRFRAGSTS
jgi:exosortase